MSQASPGDDLLIVEGILTTLCADGLPNIAPMGPRVDRELSRLTLRPFQTSTTFKNLKRTGQGVFHVVDDVELLARAAVGAIASPPKLRPAKRVEGVVLADACRWFELRVERLDDSQERTTIECRVEARGEHRPFFGFNRAKHAVVEAAILATRVGIVPGETILQELVRLAAPVEKTGGVQERGAFEYLREYIENRLRPRQ
jgi:hypothetical protein